MKQINKMIILTGLLFLFSGCTPPLHLYSGMQQEEKELVFLRGAVSEVRILKINNYDIQPKEKKPSLYYPSDFLLEEGIHKITAKLYWENYGFTYTTSSNIKTACYKLNKNIKYLAYATLNDGDWNLEIREFDKKTPLEKMNDCKSTK